MAVVPMRKVSFVGLKKDERDIIDTLIKFGAIEISDKKNETENQDITENNTVESKAVSPEIVNLRQEQARVKAAMTLLEGYDTRKKPLFHVQRDIDRRTYNAITERKSEYLTKIQQIDTTLADIASLKALNASIRTSISSLIVWVDYAGRLADVKTETTKTVFCSHSVAETFDNILIGYADHIPLYYRIYGGYVLNEQRLRG